MAEMKVRKLDPVVLKKIDELAGKKHMSREEYVRRYLSRLATIEEIDQIEEKYSNLVNVILDRLDQSADIIEINNMLLERIEKKLEQGVRNDP